MIFLFNLLPLPGRTTMSSMTKDVRPILSLAFWFWTLFVLVLAQEAALIFFGAASYPEVV